MNLPPFTLWRGRTQNEKAELRGQLVNKMTALYATGAQVIAFNNSGDPLVAERDNYCNRVWSYQVCPLPPQPGSRRAWERKVGDFAGFEASWRQTPPPCAKLLNSRERDLY